MGRIKGDNFLHLIFYQREDPPPDRDPFFPFSMFPFVSYYLEKVVFFV